MCLESHYYKDVIILPGKVIIINEDVNSDLVTSVHYLLKNTSFLPQKIRDCY